MEKRKNRPIWGLFVILLAIFLIGLLCETALKAVTVVLNTRTDRPQIIMNQVLRGFGDESLPLWAVPSLLLNWMTIMPRTILPYALRWLPYLVIFLLPVFCALLRKKAWPLIICAAVNGCVAIGIVLVRFFARQPVINALTAIPFAVETLMLVLACIALGTKSKGFSIVLGVFCVLLALISPVVSATVAGFRMGNAPQFIALGRLILMQARRLPLSAAASQWPIYKTFAFLMYALILFVAPSRFPKRA